MQERTDTYDYAEAIERPDLKHTARISFYFGPEADRFEFGIIEGRQCGKMLTNLIGDG